MQFVRMANKLISAAAIQKSLHFLQKINNQASPAARHFIEVSLSQAKAGPPEINQGVRDYGN